MFFDIVVFKTLRVHETIKGINVGKDKRTKDRVRSSFNLRNQRGKEMKEINKAQPVRQ